MAIPSMSSTLQGTGARLNPSVITGTPGVQAYSPAPPSDDFVTPQPPPPMPVNPAPTPENPGLVVLPGAPPGPTQPGVSGPAVPNPTGTLVNSGGIQIAGLSLSWPVILLIAVGVFILYKARTK